MESTLKKFFMFALSAPLFALPQALAADKGAVPNEWRSYMEMLAPIAERIAKVMPEPQNPQLRQEMHRQLFSLLATGYWHLLYQDPDNPDFVPFWYNYGAPNPDDIYTSTPIRGDGVYRISGTRGSARIVTFSIGSGLFFPRGTGDRMGPNLAEYDLDTIELGKDGAFEVLLSAQRPEGYRGNWWHLDPKGSNILVRQRSYDWRNEIPGRLAIQRLDQPIARPRQTVEQLNDNMQQLAEWTESWAKWTIEFTNRLYRAGLVNKVEVNGLHDVGGYAIQKYIMGLWDIAPDEALIYETEVPGQCRYWAIELVDELYATLDHMNLNRQSSLNGHSARLDSDGKFRAVISARDPGVPNWLDTADYQRGGIFGRWQQCDRYPVPTVKKIKLADLRKYLPADTPVITLEEREAALRFRRESYQMRHRWN